jgi:hypothetical protein
LNEAYEDDGGIPTLTVYEHLDTYLRYNGIIGYTSSIVAAVIGLVRGITTD